MKHYQTMLVRTVLVAIAATVLAGCVGKRNLTTSASLAGTSAYLTHESNEHDDLAQAREFAHKCPVALRRDAATGGGEHLDALARLLGERDQAAFGRWMQAHYGQLYPAGQKQDKVVDRILALR